MKRATLSAMTLAVLAPLPAAANDTQANVTMGGLIFEPNDQVSMDLSLIHI